ncbi:MAG: alpha/beta fold hydrolase [Crocinitomicaceae bacterium]|nr:alpha/beta fold hydrolase [Crocinitomicaceae bacterium]
MHSHIIREGKLTLEYYSEGSGQNTLICFHGHGRKVEDFLFLAKKNRKLILIVLPHHGKSKFPIEQIENQPLKIQEFNSIFAKILEKQAIGDFHFIGFSQGGRFALSLLPFYKDRLKSVQLISPDGMDPMSFYNRTSRIRFARLLFEKWEGSPKSFIRIAKFAYRLGLVRPKVFAFIELFASNKEQFQRASRTWRGFRNIKPDFNAISSSLNSNKIYFRVIMGKYDQVIRTQQAVYFLKQLGFPKALIEIECGHDFFKEGNLFRLNKAIKI